MQEEKENQKQSLSKIMHMKNKILMKNNKVLKNRNRSRNKLNDYISYNKFYLFYIYKFIKDINKIYLHHPILIYLILSDKNKI